MMLLLAPSTIVLVIAGNVVEMVLEWQVGVFSGVTVTPEGLKCTANCLQINTAHKLNSSPSITSHGN